jgi:hypothetical protein
MKNEKYQAVGTVPTSNIGEKGNTEKLTEKPTAKQS